MAANFSFLSGLNAKSTEGVVDKSLARFRTKDISIHTIYPSELNFYAQDEIEQKAAEILAVGLLSNLTVVHAPCDKGEYKLVSGERRWRALCLLVERGYSEFERVTCQIRNAKNEHEEMIALILANSAREKDIATLMKEEQILKKELEYMKEQGLPLNGYNINEGRVRDIVASMLNVSRTKVAEMEAVSNRLLADFMRRLEEGKISFSVAYKISKLSSADQEELFELYIDKGELSLSDIADFAAQKEAERERAQIPGQMELGEYSEVSVAPETEDVSDAREMEEAEDEEEREVSSFVDEDVVEQEALPPEENEDAVEQEVLPSEKDENVDRNVENVDRSTECSSESKKRYQFAGVSPFLSLCDSVNSAFSLSLYSVAKESEDGINFAKWLCESLNRLDETHPLPDTSSAIVILLHFILQIYNERK